jgi:oligosaccharide repeat unit polymerase
MAKYVTHPLLLFITVWCVSTLFYLGSVRAGIFPKVNTATLAIILINVVMFSLGYLTWSLFSQLSSERKRRYHISATILTQSNLKFSLKVTYLFGVVAFLLCLYRLVVISSSNNINFFELITNPTLVRIKLVAFIAATVHETNPISIPISVASSIFSIGFVLLGIFFYWDNNKTRYLYVLSYLLLSMGIGILNLSRKGVLVNILYLVFAYIFVHPIYQHRKLKQVFCNLFIPLIFIALLFALIDVLLGKSQAFGHESRFTGFVFSIYWYIASPLAAFNEFITNFDGNYLLGQSMFFPIHKWLYRLNLVEQSNIALYSEKVYLPYVANVYTYLRNIYEDFGILGVAAVPYLIGWVASFMRRRARIYFQHLNLYLILLVFITFSFYNYLFIANQFYLQALFGLIFFRFDLRNLQKQGL